MSLDKYFKLWEEDDPEYQGVEVEIILPEEDTNIPPSLEDTDKKEGDSDRGLVTSQPSGKTSPDGEQKDGDLNKGDSRDIGLGQDGDVEEESPKSFDDLPDGVYMLISAGYDSKEEKPFLLFYDPRREEIIKVVDQTGHKPYAYSKMRKAELENNQIIRMYASKILDITEEEKHDPLTDRDIIVSKIVVRDPLVIGGRKDSLRERIELWEADIKYYLNYLFDLGLQVGDYYVLADGRPVRYDVDPAPEILREAEKLSEEEKEWLFRLAQPVIKFRRVALDIEVYNPPNVMPQPENPEHPIFIVSLRGSDGMRRVLLLDREGKYNGSKEVEGYEVEIYRDELGLIKGALEVIRTYPIILTFNGDAFDLPYIINRAKKLGFQNITQYFRQGRNEVHPAWGIHIDLYKFFKNPSIKNYAFSGAYDIISLDTIARALIGKGKVEIPEHFSMMETEEILRYAVTDAEITYELTAFNNDLVMRLITIIGRISNMTLDDVTRLAVSNWIRNRLLYLHRKKNYLIPREDEIRRKQGSRHFEPVTKGKKYVGALVIDPVPGIHFDVTVVDFASLYPSIMKEYNISYETVNCPHPECRENKVPKTSTWICTKKRGIISEFVGVIRDIRVNVFKKLSKDKSLPREKRDFYNVVQGALKVFINAIYGVTGSEAFQFYYLPSAEAVTTYGRYIIEESIKTAQKLGLRVIYGDTDSLFIEKADKEKLQQLIDEIQRRFRLKLEVDKEYRYVVLSSRKKNYFGVTRDGALDIKGLQGKKSNTPPYIKDIFYQILDHLRGITNPEEFEEARKDIIKIINEAQEKLAKKEVPVEELVISVTLSKPIESYTKTTPQHVKAARKLRDKLKREVPPGSVIRYVKVRGREEVLPIELVRDPREIDSNKYIELLLSTLEQILDVLDIHVDNKRKRVQIVNEKGTLDQFFKIQ